MISSLPHLTLAEFDIWALKPENVQTDYEYICGEVVRREVSDGWTAVLSAHLASLIANHVREHRLGYSMNGRAGFRLGEERYMPIATYTDKRRWIEIDEVCYLPFAPTLAIEATSSLRHPRHLRRKIPNYLHHKTVVWFIDAEDDAIEVFTPDQPVKLYRKSDTLIAGEVLPEFRIALADLFDRSDL